MKARAWVRPGLYLAAGSLALAPAAPALAVIHQRWPWLWLALLVGSVSALAQGVGDQPDGAPLDPETADLIAWELANYAEMADPPQAPAVAS